MYVSSFFKLMRINVFLFSQHGIRAIKEFENTKVRVSPCGQFRKPIQRLCHTSIVLQSSRSFTEAKPSLEHLAADNFYMRPPFWPKSTSTGAHPSEGGSLAKKYLPTCSHAPISSLELKFMRLCVVVHVTLFLHALFPQVRMPPASPSIHSMRPVVAEKALFFPFFSPTIVSAFFCRLNLHCFCVF